MSHAVENGTHTHARVLPLALAALGVVYGDIGTSPLYALRETLSEEHGIPVTAASVQGVLSLIFWSLILIITVKYVSFVMRADNHGEGGILALTALITPITRPSTRRRWLILLGLFGTALLYGDGAITPAISVLSAVEGVGFITPAFEPYVIPIAVAILIGLFTIQSRGTGMVGGMFGPIMVVWFLVLALLGIIHLADAPAVFGAINPAHAVKFFTENTTKAFVALGSVFLVVTGGEALYADMGHFGARPIRLGWYTMVLPALLIHYFGQGALLIAEPEAIEHPFFRMAPGWALVPLVVLATMATIIASQALISGVFSLTLQAVQLGYSPRVNIEHTSATEKGQVYLPTINWVLMLTCIGLVIGFRSSANLAAAYGVAVTATMVITALLFGLYARDRLGWSNGRIGAVVGGFLVLDLAFFGANILKIPRGGWFPLASGLVVFTLLTTWKTGRALLYERTGRGRQPLARVLASLSRHDAPRVPGTAVFMTPNPGEVPPAFLANLRHNHVLHEDVVFLSVRTEDVPHVLAAERDEAADLGNGFHQVTLHYGFMDEPDIPEALEAMLDDTVSFDPMYTTYFLARESVQVTELPGMQQWRERLFLLLHRNATSAASYFRLPPDRSVEIGVSVEL
jgi:KUP system potassium uptake protein